MPTLSLPLAIVAILVAAGTIMLVGPRLVRVADRLADVTGLGEAMVGAVLLGATTSLPDIITTLQPALRGFGELAVSNALGGVLGQTLFIAVADLTYRRANLEHAAASLPNLAQTTMLLALLGGIIALSSGPQVTVWGVHPGSLVLVVGYFYGLRVISQTEHRPLWTAVATSETFADEPVVEVGSEPRAPLISRFVGYAAVTAGAGFLLALGGETLVVETELGESAVGVFVTGLGTSLAELVVSVAAIRAGALTLAVGNIIGGNTFDALLVAVADVAYRDGSVYATAGDGPVLVAGLTVAMTAVLLLGMLRRQRYGPGNIGFESVVVLLLYAVAVVALL